MFCAACSSNADVVGGLCSTNAPNLRQSSSNLGWIAAVVICPIALIVIVLVLLWKFKNDTFNQLVSVVYKRKPSQRKPPPAPLVDVIEHTGLRRPPRKSSTIQMMQSNDVELVRETLGPADSDEAPESKLDILLNDGRTESARRGKPVLSPLRSGESAPSPTLSRPTGTPNKLPSLRRPVDPFENMAPAAPQPSVGSTHTPEQTPTPPSEEASEPIPSPVENKGSKRKLLLTNNKIAPIMEDSADKEGDEALQFIAPKHSIA